MGSVVAYRQDIKTNDLPKINKDIQKQIKRQ
jgi:hypothetical protein